MSGKEKGLAMSTTRVKTTFGLTLDVDAAELEDLRRQGLVVKAAKTSASAPADGDDAKADADAETKGGAA